MSVAITGTKETCDIGDAILCLLKNRACGERLAVLAYALGGLAEMNGEDEAQLLAAYQALNREAPVSPKESM